MGDAFCHTDPAFAYGLSFALAHAEALGRAAHDEDGLDDLVERYRAEVVPEARERYALARETDDARTRRWNGEALDVGRRDGCYALFAFAAALAAAPHDDLLLRRTIRRIGLWTAPRSSTRTARCTSASRHLLDPGRRLAATLGPPRDELLARIGTVKR